MGAYNTETYEISPHFKYSIADNPSLDSLKQLANIDIKSETSEFSKAEYIIGFSHQLFTHNGDNEPSAADPLTILREAKEGQSFRCVEYSTLAMGLLWAYKIPARTIGLKTCDVEIRKYGAGHVVIEFWCKDYNKLVMCDVQAGIIPKHNEIPISAYELSNYLKFHETITFAPIEHSRFKQNSRYGDKKSYEEWIKDYLCFIDTPLDLTFDIKDRRKQQIVMLVPLDKKYPKSFQGLFDMNALYTHSVKDFYPELHI